MKYYAGIGSRKTPPDVLELMARIAAALDKKGYTLRSGGAAGADTAFEGESLRVESWNPRAGDVPMHDWARAECRLHCHEFPLDRMKPFIQQLLVRNMYQILGEDGQTPVTGVICWTPHPDPCHKDSGGTRYACRCAMAHGIPVWNLRNPKHREAMERWLTENA